MGKAMLFNSAEFLFFFPVVALLFFVLPHRFRWVLLLGASYFFYMSWKVEYAALIGLVTVTDYLAGRAMGRTEDPEKRRSYLVGALTINLGMLFVFKYADFVISSLWGVVDPAAVTSEVPTLGLVLPVGISFFVFQSLSYTIDVYRGTKKVETHLGHYALYVSFFPQLVAGPIERSRRLLPQLSRRLEFDYARVTDGLKRMAWGLFKKVVIADRLAVMVDTVYQDPARFGGLELTVATVFFAFQIYCDFSGYSDMAIGAARVFGVRLMDNFDRPYFATSIRDFWRRWHISLSTWFRDYVYVSLGGNREGRARWHFSLLVTFLLSGIWHGANWTFLLWGALHGTYMLVGAWTRGLRQRSVAALRLDRAPVLLGFGRATVTFILVVLAWVLFRAESLSDAVYVYTHLAFNPFALDGQVLDHLVVRLAGNGFEFYVGVFSIGFLLAVQSCRRWGGVGAFLARRPAWIRWTVYVFGVLLLAVFGVFDQKEFIYFQF